MTIISKTGSSLGLISCIRDIHKTALIYSKNAYADTMADVYIANSIGNQKTNNLSYRDAERKNWIFQGNFLNGTKETFGKIGGYLKGVAKGLSTYMPNIVLSCVGLCAKNKYIANISTAILGGIEAFNFIKNSTNITQRTDYLE